MRTAVSNLAWRPEDDVAAGELLRAAGVGGVELALTKYFDDPVLAHPSRLAAVARRWRDQGLVVVGLNSLLHARRDLALFAGDGGLEFVEYLSSILDVAASIGASRLVLGSPHNRRRGDLGWNEAFDRSLEVFEFLGDRAAARGLVICIEANPPDYGCDFLTTCDEVMAVLDTVDSPGLGMQVDTGCCVLVEDDPAAVVRGCGRRLAHVHASEPALRPLGATGRVDHVEMATALERSSYGGWVTVEMLPAGPGLAHVRAGASLVQSWYGPRRRPE
jgi:D-psicose/D-tagatose/L-ribulose 3-epimerase